MAAAIERRMINDLIDDASLSSAPLRILDLR